LLNDLKFTFLVFSIVFISTNYGFCNDEWELVPGISDPDLREVAIDPGTSGVIYVSGAKSLYRTPDSGNTWTVVFSIQAKNDAINFVGVQGQAIFVCTGDGVFASADGKSTWKRVFKGIGEKENNVRHIAFLKGKKIYIATGAGLFISNDNGNTWARDNIEGAGLSVKWIEFLDDVFIVATDKGVYKNSGKGWKRTFITRREDAEYDANISDELLKPVNPVNSITAAGDKAFIATDSGIFISVDKGETWEYFIDSGLISLRVKRVLFKDVLYAVTEKGVFIFSDREGLWQDLYKGMATKEVKSIAIDSDKNIWTATKKGLYKRKAMVMTELTAYNNLEIKKQDILERFKEEPGIEEVQKAAIEYAEVYPDKIKAWRDSANKKAILPNVSVGLDRYVTDYWHWDSGTNPDTLQKGNDTVSWDVTMTWVMSELIWNSDQTSIDTRSKLMVELRDDIMNEVTRTYFERRRLQIEMLASPPQDLKLSIEKELRIQELTADIDGLTGGYFSKQLEK
jgi:photosystem II stability/assembly factor-like uncharacterized protein